MYRIAGGCGSLASQLGLLYVTSYFFSFIANDATLVFLYVIRLIILSSKSRHGQDVWQMSVKEADFGMEQLDTFGVNREFKNSSAV